MGKINEVGSVFCKEPRRVVCKVAKAASFHPRLSADSVPLRDLFMSSTTFKCDIEKLYGEQFVDALSATPTSAFLADGSAVTVYRGIR